MVCANCAKKEAQKSTSALACSDPLLNARHASTGSGPAGSAASGRKLKENKLLSSKNRYTPYSGSGTGSGSSKSKDVAPSKCVKCRTDVRAGRKLCQGCSYSSASCAICGVKVMDTKGYKMSSR